MTLAPRRARRPASSLVLLLALALPAFAGVARAAEAEPPADLVNVDADGLALQGRDPVAYFTDGRPVVGDPAITATHRGATYRFASEEHRAAFVRTPERYAPQFGGFCAYGMSRGYAAPVQVDAFVIQDGRLLLQYDQSVRQRFEKEAVRNLARADKYWPRVQRSAARKTPLDAADRE